MNRIILFFIGIFILFSCNQEKDYVTISGLISNNEAKHIDIISKGFDKRITVHDDGSFKDTLKVLKTGFFSFSDGKNKAIIHLKNGNDFQINYDYNNLDETVKFLGKGFETSKYLALRKILDKEEKINDYNGFYKLNPADFNTKISRVEKRMTELTDLKNIDSILRLNELSRNTKTIAFLKKNYARQHAFFSKLGKGVEAPKFVDYENNHRGKNSLDDYKGKLVYIDVWATWCGPCKREIPHLQSLVEDYKDKDIEFISISVDNGRGYKNDKVKAKQAWKKMIIDKNMNWTQLYADKAWSSKFVKEFGINGIPRFILIDKKGNIIDAKAPRPSSDKVVRSLIDSNL